MADAKRDKVDLMLDAALAKYAAVGPRAGLEGRVLASLRAESARVPERVWWHWIMAGALSVIVIVALALAWRSAKPDTLVITNHPPAPAPDVEQSGMQPAANGGTIPRAPAHRSLPEVKLAANPKLDQFPSSRPLSEQEQVLLRYVHEFPEEAVLIAKSQAESEKEIEQRIGNQPPGSSPDQSQNEQER